MSHVLHRSWLLPNNKSKNKEPSLVVGVLNLVYEVVGSSLTNVLEYNILVSLMLLNTMF